MAKLFGLANRMAEKNLAIKNKQQPGRKEGKQSILTTKIFIKKIVSYQKRLVEGGREKDVWRKVTQRKISHNNNRGCCCCCSLSNIHVNEI
jgi:hypothetical protein